MPGESVVRRRISMTLVNASARSTRFCSSRRYSPHEAILEYSFVTVVLALFILLSLAMKAVSQNTFKDQLYVWSKDKQTDVCSPTEMMENCNINAENFTSGGRLISYSNPQGIWSVCKLYLWRERFLNGQIRSKTPRKSLLLLTWSFLNFLVNPFRV